MIKFAIVNGARATATKTIKDCLKEIELKNKNHDKNNLNASVYGNN
jgi:hypothetical protein